MLTTHQCYRETTNSQRDLAISIHIHDFMFGLQHTCRNSLGSVGLLDQQTACTMIFCHTTGQDLLISSD